MIDGKTTGKRLISFDELVYLMNAHSNAYSRINEYGMCAFGENGYIRQGEIVALDEKYFGVFLGNSFNPLIYRGENKEYKDFTPSIQRKEYITGSCCDCFEIMKKMQFLDLYRKTPYYHSLNKLKVFDYSMYFDFEAIAQHYGFPTNYIDVTRNVSIAMFFAYTYYKDSMYYPITDFTEYKPILYVGDIKEIHRQNPDILKSIFFQGVLRPYMQEAMAIDASKDSSVKQLFKRIELPCEADLAIGIYASFIDGEALMPKGRILGRGDIIADYEDRIREDNEISEEYIDSYCGLYQKDKKTIKNILEMNGINIVEQSGFIPTNQEMEYMIQEIEKGIMPFLERLSCRCTAYSGY